MGSSNFLKATIAFILTQYVGIIEKVQALDNNYFEACWDLELSDEDMFCYGAVNWKIDEDTYYNQVE